MSQRTPRSPTLHQANLDTLRDGILRGALPGGGYQLCQEALAKRFDASRVRVRKDAGFLSQAAD